MITNYICQLSEEIAPALPPGQEEAKKERLVAILEIAKGRKIGECSV
jgi:hypothetical protein